MSTLTSLQLNKTDVMVNSTTSLNIKYVLNTVTFPFEYQIIMYFLLIIHIRIWYPSPNDCSNSVMSTDTATFVLGKTV